MCGGGSPQAPDPFSTAMMQLGINKQAISDTAKYNQINQTNPFGSLNYTGSYDDPNNPRTQNVTLDPKLQGLLNSQIGTSQTLTDAANSRLTGLSGMGQFELPTDGAPQQIQWNGSPAQTTFDQGGPLTHSVDNGGTVQYGVNQGPIQTSLDTAGVQRIGDSSQFGNQAAAAQQAAYQAQTGLLAPHEGQAQAQLKSQLAAQGIPMGSQAYNDAINNQTQQQDMIRQQAAASAVGIGNQQQGALFGENLAGSQAQFQQALQSGQFGNEAQALSFGQGMQNAQLNNSATGQQFGQNYQNALLNNSASGQEFGQNMNAAQFANQGQQQQFDQNMGVGTYNNGVYQQGVSNNILGRNQNFNEAAAFLNGSPVAPNNPTFQSTAQYQPAQAAPNAVGLAGQNYQTAQQARSAILGSIFGAIGNVGGAAAGACWVAREVYGEANPRWLQLRTWMLTKAPKSFREMYLKHGPAIAEYIKDKIEIKAQLYREMEAVLG